MFRKTSNEDYSGQATATSSFPSFPQKYITNMNKNADYLKILGFINNAYRPQQCPIPLLKYLETHPSIVVVHRYMVSLTIQLIELGKRQIQLCKLNLSNVYIIPDSPHQAFIKSVDHVQHTQPHEYLLHNLKILLFAVGYNYCPFGECNSLLEILTKLQNLLPEYKFEGQQQYVSPQQLVINIFSVKPEEIIPLHDEGNTSVFQVKLPQIINTTDEYVVIKLIVQSDDKYANREIQIFENLIEDKRLAQLECYTRIYCNGKCRQALIMKHYKLTLSQVQTKLGGNAFELPLLKHLAIGMLEAIQCLHQQGIIHRDLKPQNIMLDSEDPINATVVIIDFDRSKIYGMKDSSQSIEESCNITTRKYEPPEMRSCCDQFYPSYDIWEFGLILSELVCFGRIKWRLGTNNENWNYDNNNRMENMRNQLRKAQCNEVMLDVICQCLQINPDARISVSQAIALLNQI